MDKYTACEEAYKNGYLKGVNDGINAARKYAVMKCEGYIMYEGGKTVCYPNVPPYRVYGTWLYKPNTQCWYCGGKSYPEEVIQNNADAEDNNGEENECT